MQSVNPPLRSDRSPQSLLDYVKAGDAIGTAYDIDGWDEWASVLQLTVSRSQLPDKLAISDHTAALQANGDQK